MTSPTAADYPRSTNWQDFERLCCALLTEVYGKRFQRWGRSGQRQDGADAWVVLDNGKAVVLQCKGRSQNLGKILTIADLDSAVNAANTFPHPIEELIVLTTAPDDKVLHDHASHLTALRAPAGLSRVSVWGWNTLSDHIGCQEKIQKAFFGHWFQRFTLRQWLVLASVSIVLSGVVIAAILGLQAARQTEGLKRGESVAELQRFVDLVNELDSNYRACERAMAGNMFLFTATLREVCATPVGEQIATINRQVQKVTPYLDEAAWQEVSTLTKMMQEDHRQALIAVEMTGFFEEEIIRGLKGLCPQVKNPEFISQNKESARTAGSDAMVAQLHYYFVLRDFVRPGLSSAKARALAQARRVMGEQLPSELIQEANVLATLLQQRQAFKFNPPVNPFSLSVVKNRTSRDIKIQGVEPNDIVEQLRWQEVFASALTKVFYGRSKDIDALISCGVFKPEARSLANGI